MADKRRFDEVQNERGVREKSAVKWFRFNFGLIQEPEFVEAAMTRICRVVFHISLASIFLAGCGGTSHLSTTPQTNVCSGAMLSGTLHDSLTAQPVAQGTAILESGTELGSLPAYNFFPTQSTTTDVQGRFSLCTQAISYPSVVVLEAMDASGKAYPPYLAQVSAAADLGTNAMGGCTGTCGLLGEQQTAMPATITGVINSSSVAVAGTVVPLYAMAALDGSKSTDGFENEWSIALPLFPGPSAPAFSTIAGTCGTAAFCSTYTLSVPAQSPVYPFNGGTIEHATVPIYLIYAAPGNAAACTPTSAFAAMQTDGVSLLTATPGSQLTAITISLTNCH